MDFIDWTQKKYVITPGALTVRAVKIRAILLHIVQLKGRSLITKTDTLTVYLSCISHTSQTVVEVFWSVKSSHASFSVVCNLLLGRLSPVADGVDSWVRWSTVLHGGRACITWASIFLLRTELVKVVPVGPLNYWKFVNLRGRIEAFKRAKLQQHLL